MKKSVIIRWSLIALMLGTCCHVLAASLESIKTNLTNRVGGEWQVQKHQTWTFVAPLKLPENLNRGTYLVFISDNNGSALGNATGWMIQSQAPYFILGTNTECVAISRGLRNHPLSRAIVKVLQLNEPKEMSNQEQMPFRKP